MRTSRIFWGTLWIVAGVLILLAKLDIMALQIGSIWKFWPLLFIIWGVSVLTGAKIVRILLAVTGGVLIALIIYSLWDDWASDREPREMTNQVFRVMHDSTLHRASLRFVSGAVAFTLRDTSEDLVHAETATNFGKYEIDNVTGNDRRDVTLRLADHSMFMTGAKNNVSMSLNPDPSWVVNIEVGASKVDADLSPFAVEEVNIKTGVADVRLRMGDRADESRVNIHAGVSSIHVSVPGSAACEIIAESGLSGKSFNGFLQGKDGRYRTANFDTAPKKIFLVLKAGVSDLNVTRY